MLKITSTSLLLILSLMSCDNTKEQQQMEELQTRLIATEAQLLNVQSELSKCSSSNDSIIQSYLAQTVQDSI